MASAQAQVPVGNWLNEETVKGVLTNGWQRALETDKDPANNNQWNRHDASNGGIGGLYGGLQETLLATAFSASRRYPVQHVSKKRVVVNNPTDSATTSTVNLDFMNAQTVTDQSSVSASVKTNAQISFRVSASAFGMGAAAGGKFGEDFTRTSANANTTMTFKQEKFPNTHTVVVPPKTTYAVTLVCEEEKVDLPYTTFIMLSGMSHTWFPARVNNHFNFNKYVGEVVAHSNSLPSDWQLDGGNVVVRAVQGTLTAALQSSNCSAVTQNITDRLSKNVAFMPVARGKSVNDFVQMGESVVSVTPMRQ